MLYLRFENEQTNRYYRLLLSKDMFNDWVLTKVWGGINQATGRITHLPCESLANAMLLTQQAIRMRLKRGYLIVDKRIEDPTLIEHYTFIHEIQQTPLLSPIG